MARFAAAGVSAAAYTPGSPGTQALNDPLLSRSTTTGWPLDHGFASSRHGVENATSSWLAPEPVATSTNWRPDAVR